MAGIDDLTMEQIQAMSPDELEAFGRQVEAGEPEQAAQPPAAVQPAQQEAIETPEQEAAETPEQQAAEAAAGTEQQEQRRGNPEVPLRQTREQLRQAQAQLEQFQQFINNPAALAQHLAQFGMQVAPQQAAPEPEAPDAWLDPEAAIKHHVTSAITPLQQRLETQAQYIERLEAERQHAQMMNQLSQQYGADAPAKVANFDATLPHMAHYHPEAKLMIMRGLDAGDTFAQQQAVKAEAQKLAEQMLAEKLGQLGANQIPVTLGGVPPAKGNEPELDMASMSVNDFNKLSDAQIRAAAKRM